MSPTNGTQGALIAGMASTLAAVKANLDTLLAAQSEERGQETRQTAILRDTLRTVQGIDEKLNDHIAISQGFISEERSHHSDSAVQLEGVDGEFLEMKQDHEWMKTKLRELVDQKKRRHEVIMAVTKWIFGGASTGGSLYGLPKLVEYLASLP